MKIGYVCTEKLPSPAVKGGAIQMMIDGVIPYLQEKHEVTVFSVADEELPAYEKNGQIEYIRFPRKNYRESVATELKHHQFDLIHIFNRPRNVKLYQLACPYSKIVLSLHNDMFSEKKLSYADGKDAINYAARITAVSHYIKDKILARFPEGEGKIDVVYSGVDLSSYPPVWTKEGAAIRARIRETYNVSGEKIILFAGRLSKNKGPHLLIHALEKLLIENGDVVLVIAGGKWFSDNQVNSYVRMLHELAEPLGEYIIFTKFIPPEKIPEIFLMADVFVCSSQWNEPLARVHYEAMAAGIPVITTNRGGNSEIIINGFNGIVIDDYQNPDRFAEAIDYLFSNRLEAIKYVKAGRKLVELNFTYKHVFERLEKVYMDALH
ncbi:glycosyl transferase [Bacillus canaveralius]|uniref:Glycosyl transferase n=1 Tax=Bacillus canaveralius TaxID=1403243 RepID=A0A2N5GKS5_9BACI|nr:MULTISPECIES: glycosyltransferase family 4 protein [Bacillus]PLR82112.1 glycosyl transferase [Bacillus canaveralius]PLR83939.1 glycosyl transferase [Bacillus sp. V33-4]PLR97982.1 glycosyl transferase [Bacillus canaveralius]RSK54437.1 glycosyltransferase family 1 protein [Bacillus canaveralius]